MPQAAALAVCAAIIFNVAEIFEKLQDAETGEFTLATISDVNWLAVVIVSALALVLAAVLLILHKSIKTMKE